MNDTKKAEHIIVVIAAVIGSLAAVVDAGVNLCQYLNQQNPSSTPVENVTPVPSTCDQEIFCRPQGS